MSSAGLSEKALEGFLDSVASQAGIARRGSGEDAPEAWREWLDALFPQYVGDPFGDHHERFWEWAWAIEREGKPGCDPGAFVGIWPRGGAKSTSVELATAALGLKGSRRYCLYVCDTQDRADDHVGNIAALLEEPAVETYYPSHADKLTGKHGNSKGWRRNRIRTAGGFTVDALGLDVAARGVKLEEMRPDLLVLDDIDGEHDTARATQKKVDTLTKSLLPAGASGAAVIAIQNLIIPNGVFARLADGRAEFLSRRIVSGPVPAVEGLQTTRTEQEDGSWYTSITGGTPTWEGQDLEACEKLINRIGLPAFGEECQHQVHEREGALWTRAAIRRVGKPPTMKRIAIGVDPSGGGDEIGIIAAGLGHDGHGYVLADHSVPGSIGPRGWGKAVRSAYERWQADVIVAEKNFGGDMVESTIKTVEGQGVRLPVELVNASRGKDVRAEPVASLYGDPEIDYQDGEVSHVGAFPEMETEMTSWKPGDPDSPNRLDALVWALTELMLGDEGGFSFGFG